jgi:hypothetical protein
MSFPCPEPPSLKAFIEPEGRLSDGGEPMVDATPLALVKKGNNLVRTDRLNARQRVNPLAQSVDSQYSQAKQGQEYDD